MAHMGSGISQGVLCVLGAMAVIILSMVVQSGNAYEFKVGGSGTWTVSHDNTSSYNQWAEQSRFQIGDSILFLYSGEHDSVLHVTKEDYTSCHTGSPLDKFTDGHTVYKFTQSGPHYFISGVADNCNKNEKLAVIVMADRSKQKTSNNTSPVPSPSPTPELSPPSPAPAGQEPPSPPPSGEETNTAPAPAPSGENSHPKNKNGASDVASGVLGMAATFIGASLLF